MSNVGETTRWVQDLHPGTVFATSDAPGTQGAVASALSRLATDDGPLLRVRSGLYWVKPPTTRYGFGSPDAYDVALKVAGPGAGPAAHSAANLLGLSTQVPRMKQVAVVGRAPKGIDRVNFVTRSNKWRATLSPMEIAALEVMRATPAVLQSSWADAVDRLQSLAVDRQINLQNVIGAARHEHSQLVRDRLPALEAAA